MKNSKKGFTLVELIIVVAVIALLAAVLIPTFSSLISKANQAKDEALVSNLNKAIALSTEKYDTVYDVLGAVKENAGFDVAKISASVSEHEILWDSVNYCFVYKTEKGIMGIPDTQTNKDVKDYQYWRFVKDQTAIANSEYSVYWVGDNISEANVSVGFDAGEAKVAQVNYVHTGKEEQKVTIRTTGGNLLVNAQNDTVFHYGDITSVEVKAIATSSYHEYGNVEGTIVVESGHVQIEKSAQVGSMILATKSEGNNAEAVPTITATKGAQVGTIVVNDNLAEVTVEEGATVATVAPGKGVELDESKVVGIKASTKEVDTDKASVFAGGLGIKNNPYLVANAQQLMYLNDGTIEGEKGNLLYLKLIEDIDLTKEIPLELTAQITFKCYLGDKAKQGVLYYFNIDGNGHDVYLADNISFIGDIRNSTLKNINVHMGGEASVAAVALPCSATMENVSVYSDTKLSYNRNSSMFVGFMTVASTSTLKLTNCKNFAAVDCTASAEGYNGLFIGAISVLKWRGNGTVKLTVNGFENHGNIKSGKFAAIGNVFGTYGYGATLTLDINNVKNEGSITSFNAPLNQYLASKNDKTKISSLKINGKTKTSDDNFLENFRIASSNETMALAENADKTLTIKESSNTNVSYYVVSISVYTNYKKGTATGTDIYTISEKIAASSFVDGKFTTTLKNLGFANAQEGATTTAVTSANTEITHSTRSNNEKVLTMTVNGELCYVVDIPYETVSGIKYTSNSLITVTAYNESGSPISSVYLTK